MLDEYAEDFGTGLENHVPDIAPQPAPTPQPRPRRRSAPNTYTPPKGQSVEQLPLHPEYIPVQPQVNTPPIYQQYVYQPAPAYPQAQQPIAPQPQQPYYPPQGYAQGYDAPAMPEGRDRVSKIFSEESKELNELLKADERKGCLRNIFFGLTCIAVIVVSFWLSYTIGSQLLMPSDRRAIKHFIPSTSTMKTGLKASAKSLKEMIFVNEVTKPIPTVKRYQVSNEPRTPVLPPEIMNAPTIVPPEARYREPETKPMAVRKASAVKSTVVNKPRPVVAKPTGKQMYRVVVGSFDTKQQAQDVITNIKADGFPVYMYHTPQGYRLQIGAFASKEAAAQVMKKANDDGYNAFISIK